MLQAWSGQSRGPGCAALLLLPKTHPSFPRAPAPHARSCPNPRQLHSLPPINKPFTFCLLFVPWGAGSIGGGGVSSLFPLPLVGRSFSN